MVLGDRAAGLVNDLDPVVGQRRSAADQGHRVTVAHLRHGNSPLRQVGCRDMFHTRPPAARRKRGREHVLGEAVARQEARVPEAHRREFLGERRERRLMDRLGATAGDPPARKIEAAQIPYTTHAEVVCKVRRKADRPMMPGDRPEPVHRTLHEELRRQ